MRCARIATWSLALLAWAAAPARADFQWLQDWQYSSNGDSFTHGDPAADEASGSVSVSVSYSSSDPDPNPVLGRSASFDYARTFSLTGSPSGWLMTMSAGSYFQTYYLHGSGGGDFDVYVPANLDPPAELGGEGGSIQFVLGDGVYTIQGSMNVDAEVANFFPGVPAFDLEFATETGQFTADLTATAVPEPSAILLLSVGAGAIGWWRRRSTSRASAPEATISA